MSKLALDRLSARFPEAILERYTDRSSDEWAVVEPSQLPQVVSHLKNDPELDFRLFLSLDAVDRLLLPVNEPRFEVVYFLRSLKLGDVVRLKCRVGGEQPELPSVTPIFQGASWWERLAWDFYGIKFVGHPDLRRILLYEEFKGHPLRKDYALRDRQPLIAERPLKDIFRGPGTSGVL